MDRDYSYVQVSLRDDLVQDVYSQLIEVGVAPNDKYDLHTTIMFDDRDLPEPLCELEPGKEFVAKINGMGKLGDAYVFHLYSPQLHEAFTKLTEAGYEHSYGTPMWHLSLAYKLDDFQYLAIDQAFAHWMGREIVLRNMAFGFKKNK